MQQQFNLETIQDIEDFTIGCTFFGTGGGGDPKFGEQMLLEVLEQKKEMRIVDEALLSHEDWMVCPYLMGTSGKESLEQSKEREKYGLIKRIVSNMPMQAAKRLILDRKIDKLSAVIPYEIGGAATASAIATAASLDAVTIDADKGVKLYQTLVWII